MATTFLQLYVYICFRLRNSELILKLCKHQAHNYCIYFISQNYSSKDGDKSREGFKFIKAHIFRFNVIGKSFVEKNPLFILSMHLSSV